MNTLDNYCYPLLYPGEERYPPSQTNVSYAPCGAVANSIFTDRFKLYYYVKGAMPDSLWQIWPNPQKGERVKLFKKGIAWPSDKNRKYGNPPEPLEPPKWILPPNWFDPGLIYGNDSDDVFANDSSQYAFKNEDLMNWMRTAAMPTFRKLFRNVDHTALAFNNGLPEGAYSLLVTYSAILFSKYYTLFSVIEHLVLIF